MLSVQRNKLLIYSFIGFLAVLLASNLFAWLQLPDNALIPIHWDIHNQPNGFASKPMVMLVLFFDPAIMLFVFWVSLKAVKKDPRKENLQNSMKVFNIVMIALFFMITAIHIVLILNIFRFSVDIGKTVDVLIGFLLMLFGNYFGKIRSNHVMGFRYPWTLKNENCWNKTHRFGGRLFFLAGIAIVLIVLLNPNAALMPIIICATIFSAIAITIIYSLIVSKQS